MACNIKNAINENDATHVFVQKTGAKPENTFFREHFLRKGPRRFFLYPEAKFQSEALTRTQRKNLFGL